ncbi:class IV lanthionine synthetase LanL [Kitasatospora sp. McL0602]|uniref:class IV lanthionine synthetase LanL n=1 Tax=Kitasatospora sp. McL0602 TaxID=3439530 RepID=UPI003F89DF83
MPAQGWKLHVSAASEVADQVLGAVAAVLADDPCVYKFAADRDKLHEINSRNSERGSAGKFITVYPADDEQFRRIAERLHHATEGLPGPGVLSDRAYAPGSRVHYRYGVFARPAELGNDGAYRSMMVGPDGARVEDLRTAGYRCPPWVVDPVEGRGSTDSKGASGAKTSSNATTPASARNPAAASTPPAAPRPRSSGVLLGGRYALTAAVRHSAKGGVFLGRETETGTDVVVKQARAHIEVDRSGREARTALRHEAMLLTRLDGQQLTPRPIELIEQDDSLFLVQERIPGQSLASWVAGRLRRDGTPDIAWSQAGPMATALIELVQQVHAQGLVLRDLSPGNVMVRPDGSLRLVDLEMAAQAGSAAGSAGTPGYRAPEQGPAVTSAIADHSTDLYALGGLLFLLSTGHDPLLPEDAPLPRPAAERLGRWLEQAARHGDTARRLAPIVLALRAEEPDRRWSLARARDAVAACTDHTVGHPAPASPLPDQLLDRLIRDGLRHVAATATPERRDRLWPTVPAGQLTDPCNVQHGAAGVLAVLARAALAPLPEEERELARQTAALAAAWIERRCAAEPRVLPGLHFGRSGTAWALLDAAEALDDKELADRAVELARRVPVEWPNPDVCHGAAGAGFLQLRLHRATGSAEYLDQATACARALLGAAQQEPYGLVWPVPKSFDSSLAGITHLGYGHGVAGVGAFLLATGDTTTATLAARTLAATVRYESGPPDGATGSDTGSDTGIGTGIGTGIEAAWWPQSAGDPDAVKLQHWCSGSSGVGSFLIRLWRATGDTEAYGLALAAGQAVLDSRWHSGVCACHGLAGNGEYLLDLAEATGEARFRSGAEELARLIASRAALRDGLLVLPDETGIGFTPAYGTGTSGALAFLLRLRHGGPRIWLEA